MALKCWAYFGLIFLLVLSMGCSEQPKPNKASDKKSEPVMGIDVSSHQGEIDFEQVKTSGHGFVFVKATQGITFTDPKYKDNYSMAQEAGLIVGAYHFYMTDDDPTDQANNFFQAAKLQSGDLPPVVDIEDLAKKSRPDLKDDLQTFLNEVEKKFGAKPIIYSGEHFSAEYLAGFSSYPFWLAEYGPKHPQLPDDWSEWTFWQWSQSGKVDGIQVDVDMNRFNGSLEELKAMRLK